MAAVTAPVLSPNVASMALRCSPTTIRRAGLPSHRARPARIVVRRAVETATAEAKAAPSPVDDVQFINPMWSQPSSEKEFLGLLQKLVDAKKLSPQLQAGWIYFYQNYRKAVESSGVAGAEKVATKVQATIADTVFNQVSRLRYRGIMLSVWNGFGRN